MSGGQPEDPFVKLLGWLVTRAGGVRRLAEHSGIGERTIEQWQAGAYPTRRRSSALRTLNDWALANVQDYPRLAGGKTLIELSQTARTGTQPAGSATAVRDGAAPTAANRGTLASELGLAAQPTPAIPAEPQDVTLIPAQGEDRSTQIRLPGPARAMETHPGEPAGQGAQIRPRRKVTARTATLLSVGIVAVVGVILFRPDPIVTVKGKVRCAGGALVQGVWVDALDDESSSGMAAVGLVDSAGAHYTWTGRLEHGYAVHVGCGGSPEDWKVIGYSDFTSSNPATFICDDLARSAELPPRHVSCAELATD